MLRSIRATRAERTRWLPGDGHVLPWISSTTHAITINRPAGHIWPWLVQVVPWLPMATGGFVVLDYAAEKHLILGAVEPGTTTPFVTWAFVLEPQAGATRLIVRARTSPSYRPFRVPRWLAVAAARSVQFVMERKQLLGIARRAEAMA